MKVRIYKVINPNCCVLNIVEVKSDASTNTFTHLVPPLEYPEIILYVNRTHQIKNVPFANGVIKGPYSITQKIDFIPNYHFLIIRLQPYGLKQLFNIKATALLNSVVDIQSHSLTTKIVNFLNSSVHFDASFAKELINKIEQNAIYQVSYTTKSFIQLASNSDYKIIKNLTFKNGIGIRTLQRNFKNEVGLSPKEYLRIKRINLIEQKMSQEIDLLKITCDFNYSDQSHFIKDFKKLRNFTPIELVKKKLLLSDQLAIPEIIPI